MTQEVIVKIDIFVSGILQDDGSVVITGGPDILGHETDFHLELTWYKKILIALRCVIPALTLLAACVFIGMKRSTHPALMGWIGFGGALVDCVGACFTFPNLARQWMPRRVSELGPVIKEHADPKKRGQRSLKVNPEFLPALFKQRVQLFSTWVGTGTIVFGTVIWGLSGIL
jgi:hypothetical protein